VSGHFGQIFVKEPGCSNQVRSISGDPSSAAAGSG
jgi:hypothetical protein